MTHDDDTALPDGALDDDALDRLLAADEAPPPPGGFADRVLAAHQAPATTTADPRKKKGPLAVASALLIALLVTARLVHLPATGEAEVRARTTVALDDAVTLVAEPGAALTWTKSVGGARTVDLKAGAVFFRVDEGPLSVTVPGATLVVTGTCFTVEVPVLSTAIDRRSLTGAVAGAAVATLTMLVVHEGSVDVVQGATRTPVPAGARVAVADDGVHPAAAAGPERSPRERALQAQVDDLETQLKTMMIAASEGKDPLVVENTRLRADLARIQDELSSYRALERETQGRPFPIPDDLPAAYRGEALKETFLDALRAAGVPGDVTSIDCEELPCIVYGEANGDEVGRDALDQKMLAFEKVLKERFGRDHDMSTSMWRSTEEKDGQRKVRTHFGIGVAPDDVVPEDQAKALRQRTGFRMKQYGDSLAE